MREIKFRVFDKVNNEMCEWYELVNNPTLLRDCLSASDSTRVDIMQFTGLKDKHGKEIWENDSDGFWVVKYDNDYGGYILENSNAKIRLTCDSAIKLGVKGNIHENPELLK